MSCKLRPIALGLVLLTFVSPAVHARSLVGRPAPDGLFATVWTRLVSLLVPGAGEKAGSSMDPNGATANAGSQMDPNGAPGNGTSSGGSATEAGSSMDPDGYK
jgi:hypothetical protein